MRSCSALITLACALAAAAGTAAHAADGLPSTSVPALASAPPIDGTAGAAWAAAAALALTTDFTNRRPAGEATTVRVAQDATALDVAFDVVQSEPLVASTVTNGSSVESDDYVEVALSPNGPSGFQYAFYANPRGARYQTSTENSAYTPSWDAAATRTPAGYTLTMRIPLAIIRSGGRTAWRAQFLRATVHANALDVWSFDARAGSSTDATFFGTLTGVGSASVATRPRARAQVYALAERTPKWNGGDTSRIGGDLALPVTPTASLLASFHPDYSNVETDQQTIAPTAFARSYTEVRPFFTQAAQSFNTTFSCTNCPQLLYTPAIPTYRDAYALEGTQGPLTFAAFDAVGTGRDDSAETVNYSSSNTTRALTFSLQNVTVNENGGLRDQVSSFSTGVLDQHSHVGAYFNYGTESGSQISDQHLGLYYQAGFLYVTAITTGVLVWQHLGAQFSPFDAYVAQNDIDGPQVYFTRTIPFASKTILHRIAVIAYGAAFDNARHQPSQNDAQLQINVEFKNLLAVQGYVSESAVRTYAREFLPFDGNGFLLGYKLSTATPSSVQYTGGPYYHGRLDAWTYVTTVPVMPNIHLTFETDRNAYFTRYPGEVSGTQWLERATFDLQLNRETEFDIGARRLFGTGLPFAFGPPDFTPVNGGNLSAAFHYLNRNGHSEIYAVYGDANSFSTTPALYLKYILYLGAPKGT